jgi:hypothetical protein
MMFEPIETWADWRDQILHAVWGAGLTFVFWINLGILPACGLAMLFAVGREVIYQHWMTCGAGCRTDLMGWLAGTSITAAVLYFVGG